jgi:acetyl esterase/lipase
LSSIFIKNAINSLLILCFSGAIILLFAGCSPVKILNTFVPNTSFSLIADIEYGDLKRQKLDIYIPIYPKEADKPIKVVIFYYGGSWDSGNRENYKFVGEALASKGFIVVIPDYRVYPEVIFPAFMNDPSRAAKWVKEHIHEYGGDQNQVFLSGHSAGAHIAVMLGVNEAYLLDQQLKPQDFIGIIGLAGPYDFLPLKSNKLKEIFGPKQTRWKSQPINFVNGKSPPMLLAVGLKDDVVWPKNTFNMATRIKELSGKVTVVEFADYGHIDMVSKLAKPLRGDGDLLRSIVSFINQH